MRIVCIGSTGQLANCLADLDGIGGKRIVTYGRPALDISDRASISKILDEVRPDSVINAAAYTAVDQAESEEDIAFAINELGPGHLAELTAERNLPLVHISTDYVFSGEKTDAYNEADPVAPTTAYGRSKLAGERAVARGNANHVILRTAWVFSPYGKNFVKTMLALAENRDALGVVADQFGNPTAAEDIAAACLRVCEALLGNTHSQLRGTFNFAGPEQMHWADFASRIFQRSRLAKGPVADVNEITTADYPTPARRPANSRLDSTLFTDRFGLSHGPLNERLDKVVTAYLRSRV